jgi:2-phosphoglycerate kinase
MGYLMGNVYIFRGKAGTGKTTLSDMLAKKLSIPIIRKDDVVDALKMTETTNKELINNTVCYNILYKIIQTNLDLNADFIVDIGLGDRDNFKWFFDRLDLKDSKVFTFFVICSNENEWRRRHEERIKNPQPSQIFKSFEHVVQHYKTRDFTPFEDDYMIDTVDSAERSFNDILKLIKER